METDSKTDLTIRIADLDTPTDAASIIALIDAYACDPMGDDQPLRDDVRERLIPALREHPTTLIFLAFSAGEPVGIATCFIGFSTFAAKQLINVHDLSVLPAARNQGVGRRLLEAVEEEARRRGYCKLTLEVLENNRAKRLYEECGFHQAIYTGKAGGTLFYIKGIEG